MRNISPRRSKTPNGQLPMARPVRAVADRFGFEISITEYPFGTAHWVRTQEMFPDSATAEMLDYLAEAEAARAIEDAITALVNTEHITSLRVGATPTDELGGLVVEQLRAG